MTGRTKLLLIVAIGAGGFPRIGRRRMSSQEANRMVLPGTCPRPRTMTLKTAGSRVAGCAIRRRRRRFRRMPAGKASHVADRRDPGHLGARSPPLLRGGQRTNDLGNGSPMAGNAALSSVARSAGTRFLPLAMPPLEIGCPMRCRRLEQSPVNQRSVIETERLDGRGLGCVDVAGDAELPRVARRTARRDRRSRSTPRCSAMAARKKEAWVPVLRWGREGLHPLD